MDFVWSQYCCSCAYKYFVRITGTKYWCSRISFACFLWNAWINNRKISMSASSKIASNWSRLIYSTQRDYDFMIHYCIIVWGYIFLSWKGICVLCWSLPFNIISLVGCICPSAQMFSSDGLYLSCKDFKHYFRYSVN